jgi:acyl-coenzyme A synthetase/AMP-(fatty) acid ligase
VAAVILQQRASISAEELHDWIHANVSAKYQRVQEVIVMEDFPHNVAGKTLKRAMRDGYST